MTFDQTFRIYEIFNFYFKNEADAKALTSEIEGLVNGRITSEKVELATKRDIAEVKGEIKEEIKQLEIKMEQGFKDILKWMIALLVGFGSLILTFAKILS
jgi:hypothetical protein